jgi:hypothetical protein
MRLSFHIDSHWMTGISEKIVQLIIKYSFTWGNGSVKNVCKLGRKGVMACFVPKNVFFSKDRSEKCVTFQKFVPNNVDAVISVM